MPHNYTQKKLWLPTEKPPNNTPFKKFEYNTPPQNVPHSFQIDNIPLYKTLDNGRNHVYETEQALSIKYTYKSGQFRAYSAFSFSLPSTVDRDES